MPAKTLFDLKPGTPFRMLGIPHRTGILQAVTSGSARVDWDTVYKLVLRNGEYKAIIKDKVDCAIIAPATMVQDIEEPVTDWGEVPIIEGVPALRSTADIQRLGWQINDRPLVSLSTRHQGPAIG